jgi:CheY-like chemotaxis protein
MITSSGELLLSIINDILDFSKIESNNLQLERRDFNLFDCVENAFQMLFDKANSKGLEFAYIIEPSTPAIIIGDITRLQQVILNLLSNAVKFTKVGGVTLTVQSVLVSVTDIPSQSSLKSEQSFNSSNGNNFRDLPTSGESSRASTEPPPLYQYQLSFCVQDTGIGISSVVQDKLFSSFQQGDSSIQREFGGTGLGLAISKRLAEAMHGSMWLESVEGEGSKFYFSIQAFSPCSPATTFSQNLVASLLNNSSHSASDTTASPNAVKQDPNSSTTVTQPTSIPLAVGTTAVARMRLFNQQCIDRGKYLHGKYVITICNRGSTAQQYRLMFEAQDMEVDNAGTVFDCLSALQIVNNRALPALPHLIFFYNDGNTSSSQILVEIELLINCLKRLCEAHLAVADQAALHLISAQAKSMLICTILARSPDMSNSQYIATNHKPTVIPANSMHLSSSEAVPNPSEYFPRIISTRNNQTAVTIHSETSPSTLSPSKHFRTTAEGGCVINITFLQFTQPVKQAEIIRLIANHFQDPPAAEKLDNQEDLIPVRAHSNPLATVNDNRNINDRFASAVHPLQRAQSHMPITRQLDSTSELLVPNSNTIALNNNSNNKYNNHHSNNSTASSNTNTSSSSVSNPTATKSDGLLISTARSSANKAHVRSVDAPIANLAASCPLVILLAEDNRINQKFMTMMMNKLGYNISIANNGFEVLDKLAQGQPGKRDKVQAFQVILMDVSMDQMDGLECTRRIRSKIRSEYQSKGQDTGEEELNNFPYIIACTANCTNDFRTLCLQAGMNDFLGKPVVLELLETSLRKAHEKVNSNGTTAKHVEPFHASQKPANINNSSK